MARAESEHNLEFATGGRTAYAYLETPPSGSGPGVIVIQEWWGLTTHIADVTRRLAAEGFVAMAPDLYGNRVTHDRDEAARMRQQLDEHEAAAVLSGAVDHLLGVDAVRSSTVGAIGFCMGGGFVLSLAEQLGDRVSAAVPFYGLPARLDTARVSADVQGHYARRDQSIGLDAVDAVFGALRSREHAATELHLYDAGHAFLNDENPGGNYDPASAALAWGRAVAFLRAHVR